MQKSDLPTYKEQFDKLTRAYIENEVNPYSTCQCFVGNLLESPYWASFRSLPYDEEKHGNILKKYTQKEIVRLEFIFMRTISRHVCNFHGVEAHPDYMMNHIPGHLELLVNRSPAYEDALFKGFEAALEELKKIHISHGEIIEEPPVFKRRKLALKS